MLTNFEEHTEDLNEKELSIIPALIKGFSTHGKENPIKAQKIVEQMNIYLSSHSIDLKMSEPRLRKCCNYIRSHGLLPLIATSDGYFVSHDKEVILSQIQSLKERAGSIMACADGLEKFI